MENGCVGQNRKGVVTCADGHPFCVRMQRSKLRQVKVIQVHDLAEGSGEVLHKLSLCIIAGVDFGDGAQLHACYDASGWLICRSLRLGRKVLFNREIGPRLVILTRGVGSFSLKFTYECETTHTEQCLVALVC